MLTLVLGAEGHQVTAATDRAAGIELVERGRLKPDLVIADFNLPGGADGMEVAARVRAASDRPVPVVILTGDIATQTLARIARHDCVPLTKPVKLKKMMSVIEKLLTEPAVQTFASPPEPVASQRGAAAGIVHIVDDDQNIRSALGALLESQGYAIAAFETCEAFLAGYRLGSGGCLLVDAYLPGMDGFALLKHLRDTKDPLPAIMITGVGDVPMAVQAMKAGAVDFIEKPVGAAELLSGIERALAQARDARLGLRWRAEARGRIARLTARQRQIMELVLAGHPSKNIAADLGISQRTVENHRNAIMTRTGCKSLPALARLALAASSQADHAGPSSPGSRPAERLARDGARSLPHGVVRPRGRGVTGFLFPRSPNVRGLQAGSPDRTSGDPDPRPAFALPLCADRVERNRARSML